MKLGAVLARERDVGQHVVRAGNHEGGQPGPAGTQLFRDAVPELDGMASVWLVESLADRCGNDGVPATGDVGQGCARPAGCGAIGRSAGGSGTRRPARPCPCTASKPCSWRCRTGPWPAPVRPCDGWRRRPSPFRRLGEPICRRLATFLIATIDKFASQPWVGETGAFFGNGSSRKATAVLSACQSPCRIAPTWSCWRQRGIDGPNRYPDACRLAAIGYGRASGIGQPPPNAAAVQGQDRTRATAP